MKLGMIGLGKMGFNLVGNMLRHQHEVVVYDVNAEPRQQLAEQGAVPADSIAELVSNLQSPKVVWMMVPAGEIVDGVIDTLIPLLSEGDIVIDGGNSHYKQSLARGEKLRAHGIHFLDVGTSGGTDGAAQGGCFMIGGNQEGFAAIEPLFEDIAVDQGYLYAGKSGSGHFLKMIHNGIEYGMMQSIAEGFELLDKSDFDYSYEDVARVWSHGSVIRSWLMDLTQNAFAKDPKLEGISGVMQSSGEGKWTVETALDLQASAPVIAMSLFMRYRSLESDTFHGKIVAALRNEFGGHGVVKSN
ncbi:phosphogluconate dehydrogenase (NAD(+)-dependent, decarboxylating) [Paenibacillus apiarius]|uniref:Decarboxylating 6-phosphogluconate dehydrogenase n=1 Tax=Paenibacillus apiarius TaxID=46240 RepID=A0ABT4E0J9_9BACL|nr:decarboxylating 6-phosphogluconate dehydrogenase [Paenibacillus apiarius]MCY9517867.1 decarboxylating 6-phosphogluconate dehydrogenase [Paenibacillus apiarius]MCY9523132.1 decarboxylating 6-phosphogluconate dehydrogenase [Paenibacillus apiarius]MCY9553914.1 decarboxylating 6-phosphogluconate dehydrogenase [Paenibacillus apiarius]MCY9559946.1 decarboxylating 6-phosphogluconate dehydrogenase [Paenibacillus apiarius]MCY9686417.1 decarboxylating 6-phosphogluconate dehydrogenase [Paenibacillus a